MSQQGGVYFRQGDGFLVVPSGTKIVVESGGEVDVGGTDLASFTTLLAAIPTADPEVSGQVWSDNGVLKVSTAD